MNARKRYTVVLIETFRIEVHVEAKSKAEARRHILETMIPAGVMKRRIESVVEE
jgi:hypothetical protein